VLTLIKETPGESPIRIDLRVPDGNAEILAASPGSWPAIYRSTTMRSGPGRERLVPNVSFWRRVTKETGRREECWLGGGFAGATGRRASGRWGQLDGAVSLVAGRRLYRHVLPGGEVALGTY
jgi:hypothetical protein